MDAYEQILDISQGVVQNDRLLKLDTPLGKNILLPLRAVGQSRIGRDYGFAVDMVSTSGKLELKQLIGQPVTLWIRQNDKTYQPHHGYVHTARRLGSDGGLVYTQLELASWLHFLRFRKDARIWQDRTVLDILADVFNAHPQARGRFRFNLYGQLKTPLAARSFCMQYEDDWTFVHRLLESEGLWGYFEQAQDGQSHTLVITDYNYFTEELKPGQIHFSRSAMDEEVDGFSQWSGTRTLQSVRYTGVTGDYKAPLRIKTQSKDAVPNQGDLPGQTEVYEYTGKYTWSDNRRGDHLTTLRMEEYESRAKRFHGSGSVRRMDAGRYFELVDHPDHEKDSQQQRQFLAIEVQWFIENNLPAGNTRPIPGSLEDEIGQICASYQAESEDERPAARKMKTARGTSDGFFLTLVEAQRMSVPYRSPFEHRKPQMQIQTAIVTGPAGAEVYTDPLNRIKARFEWDRLNPGDEKSSCWLRVAMSDTGGGYGGVHVPRVGEEILVDWVNGDCDRPIVTGRVYNGSTTPNWHSNGLLSGYRSKEYGGGSGYNQMVLDDSTAQSRMQLYTTSANSQLHLGYLIAQNDNTRGAYLGKGFDLKSDAYGAIRAGQGLYVSTHPASVAQPLDVSAASQQLSGASNVAGFLSQSSASNSAESLQPALDSMKKFSAATTYNLSGSASGGLTAGGGQGSANGFSTPIMLIASPAGVGLSSQQSVQVTADEHVSLVSHLNTHIAAGQSLIASVAEKLSLFVQNAGMKLFAAKGKVEIQAKSDAMALTSQQDMNITSVDGKLVMSAEKEVWIGAGGSYIRITADTIENGTGGKILERAASWSKQGASSMRLPAQLPAAVQGCSWQTASASASSASSVVLE
ncbi:type VI secretion system Vgr family protein [Paraburkholderia tropica]|uniref:type VI secretion system Vgr family protein n=1 Tax=Paraburkholderia tropica TaxID=92647 RepID=UPI0007ECA2A5|nr:type VI secretion system Vgr family protein [Paraburkholderia tropica]OBR48509.1 type VI secretion protein [Paraburkholderia tropica]